MWVSPGGAFAASDLIFKATKQIRDGSEFSDRTRAEIDPDTLLLRSAPMSPVVEQLPSKA